MPGFRSRSSNASPVWIADDDGNPVSAAGGGATGPGTAADATRVTAASDSDIASKANQTNGTQRTAIVGPSNTPVMNRQANTAIALTDIGLVTLAITQNYSVEAGGFVGTLGNGTGTFVVGKGGSNIATAQVAVPANTATQVVAARVGRQRATVSPTTSAAFYQGAAGVSATTGLFVPAGSSKTTETAAAIFVFSTTAITVSVEELF